MWAVGQITVETRYDSKIQYLDVVCPVLMSHHDVGWLQVAVNKTVAVGRRQASEDLMSIATHVADVERSLSIDHRCQRFAIERLPG